MLQDWSRILFFKLQFNEAKGELWWSSCLGQYSKHSSPVTSTRGWSVSQLQLQDKLLLRFNYTFEAQQTGKSVVYVWHSRLWNNWLCSAGCVMELLPSGLAIPQPFPGASSVPSWQHHPLGQLQLVQFKLHQLQGASRKGQLSWILKVFPVV